MLYDLLIAPFADFGFMRRALVACLALSIGGSSIGVFLILRRMSLMGDALAHAMLPGAALGFLLGGLSLPAMGLGGFVAGIATALVLRRDRALHRACARTQALPPPTSPRWRWAC